MSQENTSESFNPVKIVHFGDLHVWDIGWDYDPNPKRILGLGNLLLRRRRKFPPWVAQELLGEISRQEADYVLFSGDLTTASLKSEFDRARELLKSIRDKWKDHFICIPGNHDRYTPRAGRERRFETRFLGFPQDYPFMQSLSGNWNLVCFDCSVPRVISSRGQIDREQMEKLDGFLQAAGVASRNILVMGHYPLVYPDGVRIGWDHELPGRSRVLELLAKHGARAYLHGHKHQCWALEHAGMIHLNCGSAGMMDTRPDRTPGFVVIDAGNRGTIRLRSVRMQPLEPGGSHGSARWLESEMDLQSLRNS